MDNYVAPEIFDYAGQIIKKVLGTKVILKSVEWSGGGLYNKVYYVNTSQGNYILKMECDEIFLSTRKGQIENEVYANRLLQGAGVPCASVLSYDFTGNEMGKRYVFTQCITNDIVCLSWDSFTEIEKEKIRAEIKDVLKKMNGITNDSFGDIHENGVIGRHSTWKDCCNSVIGKLIQDCENLDLMTEEEISVVKAAAQKSLDRCTSIYTPTFNHNDFGSHNIIWGSIGSNKNSIYVIDLGNAAFGLPAYDEYMLHKMGDFGFAKYDNLNLSPQDRKVYENEIIQDLENILWKATERKTKDYAHCTNWLTDSIKKSKADSSRTYITELIEKYKNNFLY